MKDESISAAACAAGVSAETQQRLFEVLAHGDTKHRAWLRKAIEDFFAGRPVERPA